MRYRELSSRDFRRFRALIYEKCGISLHEGKKELVCARLGKRLRETGFTDFRSYYKYVTAEDGSDELVRMLDAISTNKTSFFREGKHFDFLKQEVFPGYEVGNNGSGWPRLRFWSAACSTGEEPYSLAMWLLEHFGQRLRAGVKILATDISTKVLTQAERGIYPADRLENIEGAMVRRYFQKGYARQEGYFRVKASIREMVEFKRLNLIEPFPFKEAFNLILCRNVMIYFDKSTQQSLVDKLYACLAGGGYLLIGHSETLTGIEHGFRYIQPSVYQKP